jgi:tight adherence protein B
MEILWVIFIFIAVVLFIEAIFLLIRRKWSPEARRIKRQLQELSTETYAGKDVELVKSRTMSEVPWLNRLLFNAKLPVIQNLDRAAVQANLSQPLGVYLLAAGVLFVVGFALASFATWWFIARLAAAFILGAIPILYIYIMKSKRLAKFEEQLPEALDMMARSLRAGHAFTGALQMVGQEFDEPLGPEFIKTLNEINYGLGSDVALRNLVGRIDSDDLKLFVLSISIQRESGGNLAEILENIGRLIRERFILKGQIKSLSGEARISAYILVGLPFVIGGTIYLMNPEYVKVLFEDPIGHMMLLVAGIMMVLGIIVMKKMITVKV